MFRDNENISDVIQRANHKKTMLLGWMEANRLFTEARNLTYNEFPTKFVWKEEIAMWTPRK